MPRVDPHASAKTCVMCRFCVGAQREGSSRMVYDCSKVSGSAYDERRTGSCGVVGVNWEAVA